jgi:hypothetical protein
MFAVVSVYGANSDAVSIRKEIKNGVTSPGSYLIANLLVQVPAMLLLTAVSFSIPMFAISNFDASKYVIIIVNQALTLLCFE